MKYLVDTDVLIDHLRKKKDLPEQVLDDGVISIITLGELIYGAYKSTHPDKSLAILKQDLQLLDLGIININELIMSEFGRLKADLEVKGKRLDDFDLLIASTAKVLNLSLITRNVDHFKRIKGLKLVS